MSTTQATASRPTLVPSRGALIPLNNCVPGELLVGTLLVLLANWPDAEARTGRRGTYLTTGAQSFRARTLPPELIDTIHRLCETFGVTKTEKEIKHIFSGIYEYQVSFSVNKFQIRKQPSLTQLEQRAIEKIRQILEEDGKDTSVLEQLAG